MVFKDWSLVGSVWTLIYSFKNYSGLKTKLCHSALPKVFDTELKILFLLKDLTLCLLLLSADNLCKQF